MSESKWKSVASGSRQWSAAKVDLSDVSLESMAGGVSGFKWKSVASGLRLWPAAWLESELCIVWRKFGLDLRFDFRVEVF